MIKLLLNCLLIACYFTSTSQTCLVYVNQPDTSLCLGRYVQLTTTATGSAPISYRWYPSAGLSNDTISNPIATPQVNTTYFVAITTANGCVVADSVIIGVRNCPLVADFNASSSGGCAPVTYQFTDLSTGNPDRVLWDFGDGTTSIDRNPRHRYNNAGAYTVKLVIANGSISDTLLKIIRVPSGPIAMFDFTVSDTCSIFSRTFIFRNTSSGDSIRWNFGDGTSSSEAALSHTYSNPGIFKVMLVVRNISGCADSVVRELVVKTFKPIVPASSALTLHATSECTDSSGWTNYFNDNNTPQNTSDDILLLSLKKNGNDIGTTGVGGFDVSVSATEGAGSNTGILLTNPLISNTSGFWVMNRYWTVKPVTQPTTPVGVRFYFNTQDLNDVNGSYPRHDLNYTDLLFYKTIGGNPDPTTNLQGATRIISLLNSSSADTTHWVYTPLDTNRHMAEFAVGNFSGGGGGATGNGSVLPLQLLSFTAIQQQGDAVLQWHMENFDHVEKYTVERSFDGSHFTEVYAVFANNSIDKKFFTYIDRKAVDLAKNIYYRVKIHDKNGNVSYSKIELVSSNNIAAITISPNPAQNFIVVNSALSKGKLQLSIYDNGGRKLFTTSIVGGANERVSLRGLQNGYYRVELINQSKRVYRQNLLILK